MALAKAGPEIPPADRNSTEVLMSLVLPRKVVPCAMGLLDGEDLRGLPLSLRKQNLAQLLAAG